MVSLKEHIGPQPLRSLSAGDVRWALTELTPQFSRRSPQITGKCLERAIRQAQADDLVNRNVASLVNPPAGRKGRPSKSFTVEEARALPAASQGRRLHAHITLILLVGLRTEEAGAALGSCRCLGCRAGRVAAGDRSSVRKGVARRGAVRDLRMASRAVRRRHEDGQVA